MAELSPLITDSCSWGQIGTLASVNGPYGSVCVGRRGGIKPELTVKSVEDQVCSRIGLRPAELLCLWKHEHMHVSAYSIQFFPQGISFVSIFFL